MGKTNIEWVLNPDNKTLGWVWNPLTGCLNHDNGLCKGGGFPCYAYKLANGRLKQRYLANKCCATVLDLSMRYRNQSDPFYPRFWEERLDDPFLTDRNICIKHHTRGQRQIPRGIFVCDMGELFGAWIPKQWQEEIHLTITCNPQHRFYLLTKQPQELIKFSPFPENCWVGVTATNTKGMNDALYFNPDYNAKVKFISFEPLLERIDKSRLALYRYDWLIIGACTGTKSNMMDLHWNKQDLVVKPWGDKWTAQPRIEWVREIVEAADKAGIKVFLKDNLKPLFAPNYEVEHPWAYKWGSFRQEMPERM